MIKCYTVGDLRRELEGVEDDVRLVLLGEFMHLEGLSVRVVSLGDDSYERELSMLWEDGLECELGEDVVFVGSEE